jgi:hypothetical protein
VHLWVEALASEQDLGLELGQLPVALLGLGLVLVLDSKLEYR